MSLFKNATNPGKVGGDSMWFPQEKGDTSKWWPNFEGAKNMKGDMPKDKKKAKEKMY